MDLLADFAVELQELADLTPQQATKLARQMVTRGWLPLRRVRNICARRRFDRMIKSGEAIDEARIEMEVRYDLTESISRMLIYRHKRGY